MAGQNSCSQHVFLVHLLLFLTQYSCVFLEATMVYKSSNVTCIKEERKALLEFKHGLTDPLSVLDSWGGEDCCNWHGIVCNNRTGNVIQLLLSGNQISGPISVSIGSLSHLDTLELSSNSISGTIPASLGNLSHLRELYLSVNSISGSIPTSLGNLQHLETLYLNNNNISGPIPTSFSNLSQLETLYLSYNSISRSIPTSLGNLSHLYVLDISSNSMTGPFPTTIGNLPHLEKLDLSWNPKLNGPIPESIGQLRELEIIGLRGCSWEGFISENHFQNLTKLRMFQISSLASNPLVFNFSHDWIPIFNISIFKIRDCKLMNPTFPDWLRTQRFIESVVLSNAGLSGTVPDWFWRNSQLLYNLDLSYNQLRGKLPNSITSLLKFINLRNNSFVGSLPLWPNVVYLSLASNRFFGPIPSNIGQEMSKLLGLSLSNNNLHGSVPTSLTKMMTLRFLDLSRNHLSGKIPMDWVGLQELRILDLSNNNLSSQIPSTLCSQLPALKWLRLSKNQLYGDLQQPLQSCNLSALDLTENKFSGNLPKLVRENSQSLSLLLLGDNKFTGNIPQQLCGLSSLQVLDISLNNLSGSIPRCLGNLEEMTKGSTMITNWMQLGSLEDPIHMEFNLKGVKYEYTNDGIRLVKKLDLSSNNLQGEIPQEIKNLMGLVSLNVSHNQFTGKIPEGIGNLKRLEALDLSSNHLWGSIPSSMTDMTSLSTLNLSSNNLSGPIPTANQFLTFNSTSFEGNSGLCGRPLQTQCGSPPNHEKEPKVDDEDDDKYGRIWLYGITTLGFIVGFWAVFGSLVIKRSWRHAYFRFLDKTKDKISFW